MINAGIVIPPNGVAKDDFIKERIKVRSSIILKEVRQNTETWATFVDITNRLDDGGLVTISTDITDLRRQNRSARTFILSYAGGAKRNDVMG